jgi:glycerol uptake facilitator-like aquaporin
VSIAKPTKETLLNIISNLIGTCVSLAGFILAALTIIVTFKSNLKVKGIEHSDNALELIFSSQHYDNIVKVYRDAILEFVILSILLYFVWAFSDFLNDSLTFATMIGIEMASFTILRSLFILFKILKLEKHTIDSKRS